jgi:hypothetical protein
MADFDTIARFMQLPLFHAVELGRCGLPMNLQQTTQIGMLCLFRASCWIGELDQRHASHKVEHKTANGVTQVTSKEGKPPLGVVTKV